MAHTMLIGTIVNNGTQTAQDPWVVATFYNSNGTVIGLNFTDYLTNSIAPGGAIEFFASPADDTPQLTSEIANYSSMVDSLTLSNGLHHHATPSPHLNYNINNTIPNIAHSSRSSSSHCSRHRRSDVT